MDAITAPTLLLVEGADEKAVATLLLKALNPDFERSIDIQHGDGNDDVFKLAGAIDIVDGFRQLKVFALIVDAEENPASTLKKCETIQASFNSQFPALNFQFLIQPSATQKGAIDSVFLQSLDTATNTTARCAIDFSACAYGNKGNTTQAKKDKLALVSYINANTKNPYSRIGVALSQDARNLFDLNHVAFSPLKSFLSGLLKNI